MISTLQWDKRGKVFKKWYSNKHVSKSSCWVGRVRFCSTESENLKTFNPPFESAYNLRIKLGWVGGNAWDGFFRSLSTPTPFGSLQIMFSVDLRLRYINYQIPRNMENVFHLNGVLTLSDSLLPHHQIFQEMKIMFYERGDLCPQEAKTTSKKKKSSYIQGLRQTIVTH